MNWEPVVIIWAQASFSDVNMCAYSSFFYQMLPIPLRVFRFFFSSLLLLLLFSITKAVPFQHKYTIISTNEPPIQSYGILNWTNECKNGKENKDFFFFLFSLVKMKKITWHSSSNCYRSSMLFLYSSHVSFAMKINVEDDLNMSATSSLATVCNFLTPFKSIKPEWFDLVMQTQHLTMFVRRTSVQCLRIGNGMGKWQMNGISFISKVTY